jgi:MoxR-like ATPase
LTERIPNQSLLEESDVSIADFRQSGVAAAASDRRDGLLYRYTPAIKLAVRVALAADRPLLILGPSGCGKSSMVFNLARLLGRRYYEFVVHSRTEAKDLYYSFDAIRRLGEAQLGSHGEGTWRAYHPFIEPGPLWWLFSPATARRRGAPDSEAIVNAIDPGLWPLDYADPIDRVNREEVNSEPGVLLIDEIDKADPDFANNLLVPIGSRQFVVQETGTLVRLRGAQAQVPPLIVITSNRERELPQAFVRRCIVLEIPPPTVDDLIALAQAHFQRASNEDTATWRRIADLCMEVRKHEPISAPEFLDAVRAIERLEAREPAWRDIVLRTTWTSDVDSRV